MKPIGALQLLICITKYAFRYPNPKSGCPKLGFSISFFEEYRVKAVHIDTQHLALRRKLAVDLGDIVITVSHKDAQKFQISAANQIACCECVSKQVRMKAADPGFLF